MDTLNYVTAIATALTISITPVVINNSSRENVQMNKVSLPKSGMPMYSGIQIQDVISLANQRTSYFLSKSEQGALKRALLRSVKVIEPRSV